MSLDNILDKEKEKAAAEAKGKSTTTANASADVEAPDVLLDDTAVRVTLALALYWLCNSRLYAP